MRFDELFRHVDLPVFVCGRETALPILYTNPAAALLLGVMAGAGAEQGENRGLRELLRDSEDALTRVWQAVCQGRAAEHLPVWGKSPAGAALSLLLSANGVTLDGEPYIAVYFSMPEKGPTDSQVTQAIFAALNIISQSDSTEEALNTLLSFTGTHIRAHRGYLVEMGVEPWAERAYEWQAEEAACGFPASELHPLPEAGTEELLFYDARHKPSPQRAAELERQGVHALVCAPIRKNGALLGYMRFDDCLNDRVWTQEELQILLQLTNILASLLGRRDVERRLRYSLKIFNTVTDNFDNFVYVSDIHTRELLFVNRSLAKAAGASSQDLLGERCDTVLQTLGFDLCSHCPLEKMIDSDGRIVHHNYVWEFQNSRTGVWYLVRDAIIKWIDGRDVHIETATEITKQKENEARLEYVASTDMMTGAYNREWGRRTLQYILEQGETEQRCSLVFLDLDGLKRTNDRFGHAAGDDMILSTVETIRSGIRRSDVVCRWGGDEFLLIIRANAEQTAQVMRKIQERLKQRNETEGRPYLLSFSYGIVEIQPNSGQTVEEIISAADYIMYQNKLQSPYYGGQPQEQ